MKLIRILSNIAAVVGLFFAFISPVSHMVFSETGGYIVVQVTSWLGIYRNAEAGDSHIDAFILISFLLSILVVWLANRLINWRNRKRRNIT